MTKDVDQAPIQARGTYRRLLWVLLVVSALATVCFTVRGVVQFVYWSDPAHRDQTLEPWMPIGFVARSYGVEREALARALELPPESLRSLSLQDLAEMRGKGFEDMFREVETAIQDLRSE
ncbi:hypothetical protein [Pseudophaeobacter profundi]|jgi:hypothetical protein|uniref:hypothetical protein n=1 Tax=Pseudophaeobacter profundi TaxID=3034152 RepID=UPI00243111EE|nr:hypothetical protein [Pseudophaeobacter profundi]